MVEVGSSLGGRYTLLNQIATGGMGTVWRAQDELLGRVVAIKVLRGELVTEPTSRARMLFEARATAAVDSPHVVHVYDVGEQPSSQAPYIVMEFVEGAPLSSILREEGTLPTDRVIRIVREVAMGLADAHAVGLVHRDIKPGNILMTSSAAAKITDFGIAHSATSADLTQTGTMVGTAKYLAPEQVEGKAATSASDIYALGIVAYECLTGQAPFVAESDLATALARLHEQAPPLPANVPPGLADLVAAMLANDPAARPSIDELTQLSPSGPSDTRPYTAVLPLPGTTADTVLLPASPNPRHRLIWAGAAAAGIIAIIAIAIAAASRSGTGTPTPQVVVVTSSAPPTTVSVSVTPPPEVPAAKPGHDKAKGEGN